MTSDVLQVGQILVIPNQVEPPTVPDSNTYTVQRGDSLWSIANRFNTTVAEIRRLNNLTSDNLSIGQVLYLPGTSTDAPSYTTYTVQRGDSLWSIANRFGVSVNEIITTNNLSTNVLQIGQQLRIPREEESGTPSQTTYTVKSGDSLWSIAKQFGTTVDAIKNLNGLATNSLRIGQVLQIPTETSGNFILYTVRSGDSLYRIANQYGVTVSEIQQLNNLSTTNLQIGQQLKIPTT